MDGGTSKGVNGLNGVNGSLSGNVEVSNPLAAMAAATHSETAFGGGSDSVSYGGGGGVGKGGGSGVGGGLGDTEHFLTSLPQVGKSEARFDVGEVDEMGELGEMGGTASYRGDESKNKMTTKTAKKKKTKKKSVPLVSKASNVPLLPLVSKTGALHTPHDTTPFGNRGRGGRGGGGGEGEERPVTTSDHVVLEPGRRIVRTTVLNTGSVVNLEYAAEDRKVKVRHIATFSPSNSSSGGGGSTGNGGSAVTAMQETEASGKDGIQTRSFVSPEDGTLTQVWSTESGFFNSATHLSFSVEVVPPKRSRGGVMTMSAAGRAKSTHFEL